MEDKLDSIANGETQWVPMIKEFYKPFEEDLGKAEGEEKIEVKVETTGEKCPECKEGDLVVRKSRYGKFIACSRYPECKYTRNIEPDIEVTCPKDGGKVVMKRTKKGRTFFGCANYPKCDFAVWTKQQLMKETGQPTTT
jgi:DNA topoisomerase-1